MAGGSRFELATAQTPAQAWWPLDCASSTASFVASLLETFLGLGIRASSSALDPRRLVRSGPAGARRLALHNLPVVALALDQVAVLAVGEFGDVLRCYVVQAGIKISGQGGDVPQHVTELFE